LLLLIKGEDVESVEESGATVVFGYEVDYPIKLLHNLFADAQPKANPLRVDTSSLMLDGRE